MWGGGKRQGSVEEGGFEKGAEEEAQPIWKAATAQPCGASWDFSISGSTVTPFSLGLGTAIAGMEAFLLIHEVVLLASAPTVDKGLAEPGGGVVEVPDEMGPAGTRVGRLPAEGRWPGSDQAALFIPWGAGHQGAQEEEEGCREAEPAHLQGLAGGLLRTAGRQGFSQPSRDAPVLRCCLLGFQRSSLIAPWLLPALAHFFIHLLPSGWCPH